MRWVSCLVLVAVSGFVSAQDPIRIASKNFNESYILSELVAQLLESEGFAVERRFGLGGTLICYSALENGEIDMYVEYTGTLSQAILKLPGDPDIDALNAHLAPQSLKMLAPLGFNNTYAIAVREVQANELGLQRIGDLAGHPQLQLVFSHEFLEREDGWPGLKAAYGLPQTVTGIEHGLAYQAIADGAIDVTDAYSTDGELLRYGLKVLEDELGYFPAYFAAPLIRSDLPVAVQQRLSLLAGTLDDAGMQALNSKVVFEGASFAEVAAEHLASLGIERTEQAPVWWSDLLRNTIRHLQLTAIALFAAIVVGVGLALLTFRNATVSGAVIYVCGLLQTVPSIALLALMIPLFGIGFLPAVVALFLYSLLPILRNTVTALTTIEPTLIRVAVAMGLSPSEQLRHVYLPLSLPAMFAGIRTAAVISIGTATLAAFIGAGGLGDPIVTGLSLNDTNLILQGAIPAAGLAIVTELLFEMLERKVVTRG